MSRNGSEFSAIRLAGLLVCMVVAVAACAPRDVAGLAKPVPGATIQTVLYATQRTRDQSGQIFGEDRNERLHYGRAVVSVPPGHEPGQIEWSRDGLDAEKGFALTELHEIKTAREFRKQVFQKPRENPRETMIYVHGYNTTASEAVFRVAQIQQDFGISDPTVLFTWPSAGEVKGYAYDRDSVLFARDDLEAVLNDLTRQPGHKVFILAHSLGTHLTMEALRGAAIRGNKRLLNGISGVALMSPDIDPDVFRRQAKAIGKLPQPFVIFAAQEDRALGLSALLTGRKPRLGRITGPEAVDGLDVHVIDVSGLGEKSGLNHAIPVSSPAAIAVLQRFTTMAESGLEALSRYVVLGDLVDGN